MNYTSIEQSKKLLELGLNLETADKFYQNDGYDTFFPSPDDKENAAVRNIDLPCWSVGALLDVMPEYIKLDENYYHFNMTRNAWPDNYWYLWYSAKVPIEMRCRTIMGYDTIGENKKSKSITEAAYNMVEWLLEKGYIKKGE